MPRHSTVDARTPGRSRSAPGLNLGSLVDPRTPQEQRLLDIVKVAADVFREHGFEAGTLEDVADRLGITRPALYHYFKSKQEMFAVTINYLLDLGLAQVEEIERAYPDPFVRLRALLTSLVMMIGNERSLFTVFFRDGAGLDERYMAVIQPKERRYVDHFRRAVAESMAAGYLPTVPEPVATQTLLGACIWTYTWLDPAGPITLEQASAMIADILTKPRSISNA